MEYSALKPLENLSYPQTSRLLRNLWGEGYEIRISRERLLSDEGKEWTLLFHSPDGYFFYVRSKEHLCIEDNVKQILKELAISEERIATLADVCINFNDGLLSISNMTKWNGTAHEQHFSFKKLLDETLKSVADICSVKDGYAEIRSAKFGPIFSEHGNITKAKNCKENFWKSAEEISRENKFVLHVTCFECKKKLHCEVGNQYDSVIMFPLVSSSSFPIGYISLFLKPEEKNIKAESIRIVEIICRIITGMIYSRLYEDNLRSEAEEMVNVARSFSHETGRFLTMIKRWIELWPESEKPKGKRMMLYLEQKHDNRLMLLKLIRGFIRKDDVQKGLSRLKVPVVNWIIHSVVDSYSVIAETEGRKIHFNPSTELTEPSSADVNYCAGLIELVVTNLVLNAVEYAKKEVTITFKTALLETKNLQFIIIVEDDGPGLDPETRDRIFTRNNDTAKDTMAKEDQGLGLPLSLMVARRYLDGDIVYEENIPGARFVFKFPLESEKLEK